MRTFKEFLTEKIDLEDTISKLNLNNERDLWKAFELVCKNSDYTGYSSFDPTCFDKPFKIGEWVELFTEEILGYKRDKNYYDYEANIAAELFKNDKRLLDDYVNTILDVMDFDIIYDILEDDDYSNREISKIVNDVENEYKKAFTSAKKESDVDIEKILKNSLKEFPHVYREIREENCIPDFFESFWAGYIGEYYKNMNDFCKAIGKAVSKSYYKRNIFKNLKEFIESGDYKRFLK